METKEKKESMNLINNIKEKKPTAKIKLSEVAAYAKDAFQDENGSKKKAKKCRTVTKTEAEVDWATMANKITIPNIAKGGITVGGGYVGSLIGAGFLTGLGFAFGGPAGAAIGYNAGCLLGCGAGAVASYRFGKVVADKLTDEDNEEVVTKGNTKIIHETVSVSEKKKGEDVDE